MGNNKRLKIKYLIVFSILLQYVAVKATTIPLREIGANGEESDVPTERCNCMGCSPCPPLTPPPVTPPPITPPPITPPPITPPPVTPPPITPPPITPPPITPPTTTIQPPAISHQPICTTMNDPILPQLMSDYCHQCSNPTCSSSPNGATFPYPNHCQFFWKCQNGITTVCYCPNGMWFDRVLQRCNYCPNVTNCPANIN